MKRYLIAAAMFMSSQIVFAGTTDLLGLDKLSVGAKPSYSKYIVKDKGGYLTGEPNAIDNGSFEFPVNLSGNFAVTAEYEFGGREEIRFSSNEYPEIKVVFQNNGTSDAYYVDVYIGEAKIPEGLNTYLGYLSTGYEKFKLSFISGELKIYDMKNTLRATIPLNQQNAVSYTKLVVAGIRETDKLSKLEIVGDTAVVSGGGTVTCPTSPTTPATSTGGVVTLDANLNMHIPNATYQPALGNPINLWANFQFVPSSDGSMTWKLSNYGVNP